MTLQLSLYVLKIKLYYTHIRTTLEYHQRFLLMQNKAVNLSKDESCFEHIYPDLYSL